MNVGTPSDRTVVLDGQLVPAIDVHWFDDGAARVLCFTYPTENGAVVDVQVDVGGRHDGRAAVYLRVPDDQPDLIGREATVVNDVIRPVIGEAPRRPEDRILLTLLGPRTWSCDRAQDLLHLLRWLAELPARPDWPVTSLIEVGLSGAGRALP